MKYTFKVIHLLGFFAFVFACQEIINEPENINEVQILYPQNNISIYDSVSIIVEISDQIQMDYGLILIDGKTAKEGAFSENKFSYKWNPPVFEEEEKTFLLQVMVMDIYQNKHYSDERNINVSNLRLPSKIDVTNLTPTKISLEWENPKILPDSIILSKTNGYNIEEITLPYTNQLIISNLDTTNNFIATMKYKIGDYATEKKDYNLIYSDHTPIKMLYIGNDVLKFSHDGKYLISYFKEQAFIVFRSGEKYNKLSSFTIGDLNTIKCVKVFPDNSGAALIVDNKLVILDLINPGNYKIVESPDEFGTLDVGLGNRIFCGSLSKYIYVFDQDGTQIFKSKSQGRTNPPIAASKNSDIFYTIDSTKNILKWDGLNSSPNVMVKNQNSVIELDLSYLEEILIVEYYNRYKLFDTQSWATLFNTNSKENPFALNENLKLFGTSAQPYYAWRDDFNSEVFNYQSGDKLLSRYLSGWFYGGVSLAIHPYKPLLTSKIKGYDSPDYRNPAFLVKFSLQNEWMLSEIGQ